MRKLAYLQQQDSFEEIKCRLLGLQFCICQIQLGDFIYIQIQTFATASVLYQIQNGKPKLITYASKRLPEAAKNYSITELELCGFAINIASFSHLLKSNGFDVIVDHLSLTPLKAKWNQPPLE